MAIREIVIEGDDILTKVCRPVEKFDEKLGILLDDMRETMVDADGVGLCSTTNRYITPCCGNRYRRRLGRTGKSRDYL